MLHSHLTLFGHCLRVSLVMQTHSLEPGVGLVVSFNTFLARSKEDQHISGSRHETLVLMQEIKQHGTPMT